MNTLAPASATAWRRHVRAGDVLVFGAALAATIVLGAVFWSTDTPRRAIVRTGGRVAAELPLDRPGRIDVRGPLGVTHIEIEPGRARVAADPGPRQYCVKQGWLTRAGAVAICAPNEVTLSLEGRNAPYDSLAY
ncbi:MAG: NusG domain II-containing protein [Rhodocyclaceae bacterium]